MLVVAVLRRSVVRLGELLVARTSKGGVRVRGGWTIAVAAHVQRILGARGRVVAGISLVRLGVHRQLLMVLKGGLGDGGVHALVVVGHVGIGGVWPAHDECRAGLMLERSRWHGGQRLCGSGLLLG